MANLYTVEELLVGKRYNSASLAGVIISATKTDKVYYQNAETYLVEVREDGGFIRHPYRYVAVRGE
jgi:hypothetical protein